MPIFTEAWSGHLDGCRKLVAAATPYATCGTLTRINGLVMEANGNKLPLGSGVRVAVGGGGFVEAEVVGFHGEKLYMMPTDDVFGLAPGAQVAPFEASHARPRVGERIFARFVRVEAMTISPTDETTVPHYFGPCPNWANSPFRLPDVTVELTGGGGSGATAAATVDPVTGELTDITMISPGSGYTSAPTVVISSGFGTDASATASVDYSGVLTSVSVDLPGGGYTMPIATILGGGASVDATATVYGGVDMSTLTDPGSGYTMPVVEIGLPNDPNGTQAVAHAEFDGANITSIVVDNPGSGYSAAPVVIIHNGTVLDPEPFAFEGGYFASAVSTIAAQTVTLNSFGENLEL